jgi:hypothetical protein
MSSEQLADGVNPLDAELAATWDVLKGYSGRDTDLGIARRFGGAAAAYSLRNIGSDGLPVVNVRRDLAGEEADAEEKFSAHQVSSGALEDWVNGKLERTLPADVATAAAAYSLRKVKDSYGIPTTVVNGTDGFPTTLTTSNQTITGTSFTVKKFTNNSPDSSDATAVNGVYRVSATKTSSDSFASSIRIQGLEDGKQYTVKGEFRMVEDTTAGGDSLVKCDISDNTAGTDEDKVTTTSTTFVPFFIDAGYNSGGADNFIDFTVATVGAETGTITAEFRNVQIIENNNSAVRIRRSSDNEEVVVGFDSDDKVSASSPVTATDSDSTTGGTTATTLNGFLNESVSGFTSVPYSGINASYKNFTSDPTISDTAFSGTNGGTQSRLIYLNTTDALVTASDFDVCKVKVTGTVNTLSGGNITVKPATTSTGGGTWTPSESDKVLSTTGAFEYIFTGDGTNGFRSVVFLIDASTTVNVSNLTFEYIEHGATVHTWYDQAGINNAVQETDANQPQIAANGALLADGLLFDDSNDFLQSSSQVLTGTTNNSIYCVVKTLSDNGYIAGSAGTGVGMSIYAGTTKFILTNNNTAGTSTQDTIPMVNNQTVLVSANFDDGTTDSLHFNSNTDGYANGSSAYSITAGTKFTIGARDGSTAEAVMYKGSIQEIIAYDSFQGDNRFKIESNINNYYGLYNDANETSATAFSFSGERSGGTTSSDGLNGFTLDVQTASAFAGFQLSQKVANTDKIYVSFNAVLTGGSGGASSPQLKLRTTSISGSTASNTADVVSGFNSFELTSNNDNAEYLAFSEGDDDRIFTISEFKVSRIIRDGFVETWYDQSGNGNNATQIASGNQPNIVKNGGLIPGGMDFDGTDDFFQTNNAVTITSSSDLSFFTVYKPDVTNSTLTVLSQEDGTGDGRGWLSLRSNADISSFIGGSEKILFSGGSTTNETLTSIIFDDSASTLDGFKNSASGTQATSVNMEAANGAINIGENKSSGERFNGTMKEIIIYLLDKTSDRSDIEDDINNHYNIY